VWSDIPVLTTTTDAAVADGLVAPVSLTVFERAGAGAGPAADLTQAQAVRAAPGLDADRLAAAWDLAVTDAHALLRGSAPAPAAPAAAAPEEADA
jgi:hypothetical protein